MVSTTMSKKELLSVGSYKKHTGTAIADIAPAAMENGNRGLAKTRTLLRLVMLLMTIEVLSRLPTTISPCFLFHLVLLK